MRHLLALSLLLGTCAPASAAGPFVAPRQETEADIAAAITAGNQPLPAVAFQGIYSQPLLQLSLIHQTYSITPYVGGALGLLTAPALNFGSLNEIAINGGAPIPSAFQGNAYIGGGSLISLAPGQVLTGGGHSVGGIHYNQCGGMSPLCIGGEAKLDLLSTANVALAAVGDDNLNQVQAGAQVSSLIYRLIQMQNVGAPIPFMAGVGLTMSNTPEAGVTLPFVAGVWMQPPASIPGNIGTVALLHMPSMAAVPGYNNVGAWNGVLIQEPKATIDTAGPIVARNTVTLGADPALPLQAATKQYVDAHSGSSVSIPSASLLGGTGSALSAVSLGPGLTLSGGALSTSVVAYSSLTGLPTLGSAASQPSSAFDAAGTATSAVGTETARAQAGEGLALAKASNLSDVATRDVARANLGAGPNVFNIADPVYGGPSDGAHRGPAHVMANGATVNLGAYYTITTTVSCTSGSSIITVSPASAVPSLGGGAAGAFSNKYFLSAPGCGASGGNLYANVAATNVGAGTITANATAGTTFSGAATLQILCNDTSQNAPPAAVYYGPTTVALNGTVVLGAALMTASGNASNGGQRIAITGAGAGGSTYYGRIVTQQNDGRTFTVYPLPATAVGSGSIATTWGFMLFDPDDGTAGGGRYIEIPKAGTGTNIAGGTAAYVGRIASVSGPLDATLTASVPNAQAAFVDGYVTKGSDYWPAFKAAVSRIGTTTFGKTRPSYAYFAADAFMATASGDQSLAGYVISCGEGQVFWPEAMNFSRGNSPCFNTRQPSFPDGKDVIPSVHLKRLASLAAGSNATIAFVGASQMMEGTNGAGYINGWEHEICDAVQRAYPDLHVACQYLAIGGTQFGQIDPAGAIWTGSVAGVPPGTLPAWYTTATTPWLTYVENTNPDVIVTGWTNVDGASIVRSAIKSFVSLTQGTAWNTTTGKSPDLIFGLDGYQPLNVVGQWQGDFAASMLRTFALSGSYTMANGGRIGVLDASRMAHLVVDGFDPETMPMRRNQSTIAQCQTFPCTWPAPTTDYSMIYTANYYNATSTVAGAFAAVGNELDYTLGAGANATPYAATAIGGAQVGYPGNVLRIFYNTGTANFDYQVDAFSFSTTANCSGSASSTTITCGTAAANIAHQLGTVSVPGGGASGATLTASLTKVSLDGKTLTLGTALSTAVSNVSLKIYDTTVPRTASTIAAGTLNGSCYINSGVFVQLAFQMEVRGHRAIWNYCQTPGPNRSIEVNVEREQTPFYPSVTAATTAGTNWTNHMEGGFGVQGATSFFATSSFEAAPQFPPYLPTAREMVDVYGACPNIAAWDQQNLFGGQCANHRGNLGATLIEQPVLSALRLR